MRVRQIGRVAGGAAAVALFAVGCSSDAVERADATAANRRQEATVRIEGFRFLPAATTVRVGGSVTWTKIDRVEHTVTSGVPGRPSGSFDRRLEAPGAPFSFTFERPGVFPYYCDVHRFMRGEVIVA